MKPGQRRRLNPLVRAVLVLVLAGAVCYAALVVHMLVHSRDQVIGEPEIMVILGCQVKPWGPSTMLQDRLDTALEYLTDHPEVTEGASGGQGPDEPVSEARCIRDWLVDHGVAGERILMEGQSRNTWQNVRDSAALLAGNGYDLSQPVLLVTNCFHVARAQMLWQRAVGTAGTAGALAAPASHFPSAVYMFFREPLGMVKSFLTDR